jgi:hypothetical protein
MKSTHAEKVTCMAAHYISDPWKAYAGWMSPAWAQREDFDAAQWCDKLRRGGFENVVIHAKHHDGICFFPSDYRDVQPLTDYFGELVGEARRSGMGVITYYSTLFDTVTAHEHPELACRQADGSVMETTCFPFPIGICCHNNPSYRDLLLGQLTEIQERYNTDGFWMDGFDYNGFPSGACFCEYCQRKFAEERGGSLREVYRTDIPRMKGWHRDVFLELLGDIVAVANSDGGERIVTYNNAGESLEPGFEKLDELCALNSTEAHSPVQKSTKCRLLAAQGRPYEIYSPISDIVFSWTPRTSPLLELEAGIIMAHGGAMLAGLDITPSGYIPDWQMDQLGEIGAGVRGKAAHLDGFKPIYDVALMTPKDRWKDEDTGWNVLLLRNHISYTLLPLHPVDLSPYRVVIVTDDYTISPDIAERLRAYVEAGGHIIVERDALERDALEHGALEHGALEHGAVGGMNDGGFVLGELLGIQTVSKEQFETTYVDVIEPALRDGLWDEPVRCDGYARQIVTTTAETLAHFVPPVARYSKDRWIWRQPNPPMRNTVRTDEVRGSVITVNHVGKGKAVYLGCALSKPFTPLPPQQRLMARLCANIVHWLDTDPILRSESPSGVEIVVGRDETGRGPRHVVHFLNHYVAESMYDRDDRSAPVLSDVAVWLNEQRVGKVSRLIRRSDGAELPLIVEDGWVEVRLDRLRVHEMVVLEGVG